MEKLLPKFFDILYKHWYKKLTPIVTILLATVFLLFHFIKDDINELSKIEFAIILIIDIIVLLIWISTTRIPYCSNKKIGIGVAIACETKGLHEKIYSDFIQSFSKLLNKFNKEYLFEVIEFPERISKSIKNTDDAISLLKESNCRFLLYGQCKTREINQQEQHFLNFDVAISHKPIPIEVSKNLSREINKIFPRRLRINAKNDVFSFEATSEWIFYLTRYILGLAAFISNADDYAEILFRDTINEPAVQKMKYPTLKKVYASSQERLADLLADKASLKYELWTKNKGRKELLEEVFKLTIEIKSFFENHYKGNLLNAICKFVLKRDVGGAIYDLELCRYVSYDHTWRMSLAFLYAYKGNLAMAEKHYERAFKGVFQPHVPLECEEFIFEVLKEEPNKIQFYFCLGVINLKVKEDIKLAKDYFQVFIDQAQAGGEYQKEVSIANELIRGLNK